MTKMTLTKWPRVMSFLSCFFVVSRISCNFAISKPKAIWHRHGVSNITRWLQWNYCPLPIASCKVISKPLFVSKMPPAAYEISSSEQGVLLPFVDRLHPHFCQLHHRRRPRSWGHERVFWRVSRSFFAEFRQYFMLFIQGKWVHFTRSSSEKRPILSKNRWKSWKSEPKTHHYG